MKTLIFCLGLFFSSSLLAQDYLNVMTFNVRFNNPRDGDDAWPKRKDYATSQIAFHEVHVLGVQEALNEQIMDILAALPKFRYVGVGRDDGKTKGEYSAILYDSTRVTLLETKTFWLSQTPEVPGSKGWDADITRIVTWAKFRDRRSKKHFYFFNTHFDHRGEKARKESAIMLKQKVKEIAGTKPSIITGDFNAKPSDEPIKLLVDENDPDRFTDTKAKSVTGHYGPEGTFNDFKSSERDNEPIDHIFFKQKIKVLKHATISQTWKGHFSSDHFPVLARLIIE